MNAQQKKAIRNFFIMLLGNVVVSGYLSGMFHTLVTGYTLSFNPIKIIDCMVTKGFPSGLFIVLFGVLALVELYAFLYHWQNAEGMDKMGRLFKLSQKRKVYGDTHFEEPKEYRKTAVIQNSQEAYGTILGQLDDTGEKLINFRMDKENRLNQHIAVVGASGSGKTFTFSKPYCFQVAKRRESIILTDPDGGLYRDTAGYFQDKGYVVRRFDLSNLMKSDGWDCLKSVQGDELNAQLFAQTVISNLVEDVGSIYGSGPLSLLKALILKVSLSPVFPEDKKNIQSVYEMLQNPAGEDFLDKMFNASDLTDEERPCLGPYLSFKQGSANLRGNLLTNLAVQLQLLQNNLVCRVLSTDDIDLLLPATQPCAYYCIFPDSHDTFKFVVSLFFSMLFTTIITFADRQENGRCPVPVNFLLDEFPSIGVIPDFDRKMATIRKRAMNVAMIFQDLTQLQNNYKDSWVTLLSNCSTFLSLGINDEYTSDWVTRRIGETTVEVQTEQHAAMESIFTVFRNRSTGEGKRALLSYDELFKLGENDSVILFQNHNPILAQKYPFVLHPEAKKLRTIHPSSIPDITNRTKRTAMREKEDRFVRRYLEKHPLSEIDRSYAGVCEPQVTLTQSEIIMKKLKDTVKSFIEKMQNRHKPPNTILGKQKVESAGGGDEVVLTEEFEFDIAQVTDEGVGYKVDPSTGEIIFDNAAETADLSSSETNLTASTPLDGPPGTSKPPEPQQESESGLDALKRVYEERERLAETAKEILNASENDTAKSKQKPDSDKKKRFNSTLANENIKNGAAPAGPRPPGKRAQS